MNEFTIVLNGRNIQEFIPIAQAAILIGNMANEYRRATLAFSGGSMTDIIL